MGSIDETLSERVRVLLDRDRELILSTTGTRAAVDSLIARTEALEDVVRELAEVVSELAEWQHRVG